MKKWKKGNFYTNLEDWELYKKSLSVINPIPKKVPSKGSRVHLHSIDGIYEVVGIDYYTSTMKITCKKWSVEVDRGQRFTAFKRVPLSDFRCKYGEGTYNKLNK